MSDTKQRLYVFDFDGTLTKKDTLIEFIRYAKGNLALLFGLLLFSPLLVLMKLHLADNGKTKQRLFSFFFKGMSLEDFNAVCDRFGIEKRDLLRQGGRMAVLSAMTSRTPVIVVSASIDNWVVPFFYASNADYGFVGEDLVPSRNGNYHPIEIIGTQIEVRDGKLTGRFLTHNCYGSEKIRRLKAFIPDLESNRTHYYIIAYGDSRGDKEMLEYADEGHYKPFR